MTKAEKIKALETELKLERAEHNATKDQLREYKKYEQFFAIAHAQYIESDCNDCSAKIVVQFHSAPFGAGNWTYASFTDALQQFLVKWNLAAQGACLVNPYANKEA